MWSPSKKKCDRCGAILDILSLLGSLYIYIHVNTCRLQSPSYASYVCRIMLPIMLEQCRTKQAKARSIAFRSGRSILVPGIPNTPCLTGRGTPVAAPTNKLPAIAARCLGRSTEIKRSSASKLQMIAPYMRSFDLNTCVDRSAN
jgi:hypothetical protein